MENKNIYKANTNNLQNYSRVNEDELINAYIGKNAEKLRKGFNCGNFNK